MRAPCGCLEEDGMVLHGFDGPCMDDPRQHEPRQHEPTTEDLCAQGGHAYAGDDAGGGRCYCGQTEYPLARLASCGLAGSFVPVPAPAPTDGEP